MFTGNKNTDYLVLERLEDKELVKICQTNQYLRNLCRDEGFWLRRIQEKFPYLSLDILNRYKGDKTWSQYYIEDLRLTLGGNVDTLLIEFSIMGRLDLVIVA